MRRIVCFWIVFLSLVLSSLSFAAECRKVSDEAFIGINPVSLKAFQKFKLTRDTIFSLLKSVAAVETSGCWAGISGNFDGQLISAGVLQWNYGKNSIQDLLRGFKSSKGPAFSGFLGSGMPQFGKVVFSEKCLASTPKGGHHPCESDFLAADDDSHKQLRDGLAAEMTTLFEQNEMIQVQMDRVMAVMEKTLDFSRRLFGDEFVNERNFHWMLDIIVQQGGFDNLEEFKQNVDRGWAYAQSADSVHKHMTARGILLWYAGHATSPDQDGLDCDWRYNIERWAQFIRSDNFDDERFKLFLMSWVRARTASGEDGRWQALAFERRAKIGLGIGSVAGSSVQRDNSYPCKKPTPSDVANIMLSLQP